MHIDHSIQSLKRIAESVADNIEGRDIRTDIICHPGPSGYHIIMWFRYGNKHKKFKFEGDALESITCCVKTISDIYGMVRDGVVDFVHETEKRGYDELLARIAVGQHASSRPILLPKAKKPKKTYSRPERRYLEL